MKSGLKKYTVALLMPLSMAALAAKGDIAAGESEGLVSQSQSNAL
jgi:hypothetical protein